MQMIEEFTKSPYYTYNITTYHFLVSDLLPNPHNNFIIAQEYLHNDICKDMLMHLVDNKIPFMVMRFKGNVLYPNAVFTADIDQTPMIFYFDEILNVCEKYELHTTEIFEKCTKKHYSNEYNHWKVMRSI